MLVLISWFFIKEFCVYLECIRLLVYKMMEMRGESEAPSS